MTKSRTDELRHRYRALLEERRSWDGVFNDITDFITPSRGFRDGQTPNDGKSRNGKIIDSTATRALNIFAAGLQSGLSSPARPWFRLRLRNEELNDRVDVKRWLAKCEKIMRSALASSNFYHSAHTLYTELGAYGTAVLYEEFDEKNLLNFRLFTNGEYVIANDEKGRVDTVIRKSFYTARQMVQKFGEENLSRQTVDMAKRNPDKYISVLHFIQPRENFDPAKLDYMNMPFESVYIEEYGDGSILFESGFREFPCMCPRYSVKGADAYGYGAAFDILPDVKMLQEMNKSMLKALHKIVEPPMQAPESMKDILSFVPASVNYIDSDKQDAVKPLYQINYDVSGVNEKISDIRTAVREGFFNNLFLSIAERPNMTATEAIQRHEEKLLMLGTIVERIMFEFLDPLIERTFGILAAEGVLPKPPADINPSAINVEYTSLLSQVQKISATANITGVVEFLNRMKVIDPSVVDWFNAEKALVEYSEAIGGSAEIIRSRPEVERIRLTKVELAEKAQHPS